MYEHAFLKAEEIRLKELLAGRKVESDASPIADRTLFNCGGPGMSINVTRVPLSSRVSPNVAFNRMPQLSSTVDMVRDKPFYAT